MFAMRDRKKGLQMSVTGKEQNRKIFFSIQRKRFIPCIDKLLFVRSQ